MSEPSEAAKKLADGWYDEIGQRFDSKLTCGSERDEPWWDWLCLWLRDQAQRALDAAAAEAYERAANIISDLALRAINSTYGDEQAGVRRLASPALEALRALAASKPDCIPECKENRRKYAESVQFRLDVARGKALLLEQAEQPDHRPNAYRGQPFMCCKACGEEWPCPETAHCRAEEKR